MDKDNLIIAAYIFLTSMFFSAVNWLNIHCTQDDAQCKTIKKLIHGSTDSLIGGIISVAGYAALQQFVPTWGMMLQASVSIIVGSFASRAVIDGIRNRITISSGATKE